MYRFQTSPQRIPGKKLWVSLLLFLFLILLFTLGTSSLSENTVRRHYGLIYDDSLFFVDYRTQGSNIYPEVTIIERGR